MGNDDLVKSGLYGGDGGIAFDDHPAPGRIMRLVVRHGDYIDGLAVFYGDRQKRYGFGTGGGSETVIDLEEGNQLIGIAGHADRLVNQLTLCIKRRRWVAFSAPDAAGNTGGYEDYADIAGPFGQAKGARFSVEDKSTCAFFGRSGDALDAIGVWHSTYEVVFAIPPYITK